MTNLSATLRFLLAALILNSGIFGRLAMCKLCTDGLARCDYDEGCISACATKYPGSEGSCELVQSMKLWYCYYNFGGQQSATIYNDTDFDVCDQDCSAKCATKHAGGQGSCGGLPFGLCQCLYWC